jgi:hypothetical protein
VGDFVTQCGCFLDDPVGCDRDVPYLNPQCLFGFYGDLPMTSDFIHKEQTLGDFTPASLDILAQFETTDDIKEAKDPTALYTALRPYVKELLKVNQII